MIIARVTYTKKEIEELAQEIDNNNSWNDGLRLKDKNRWFDLEDGIILVKLTQGKHMIMNYDKIYLLKKHCWHYAGGYAKANIKGVSTAMHRLLIDNLPKELCGDHLNRIKLDNCTYNLRAADKSQNAFNTDINPKNKIGCKGVGLNEKKKYYYVSFPWRPDTYFTFKKYGSKEAALEAAIEYRKSLEEKYCDYV